MKAQRPSALSSHSVSDSIPQCPLLDITKETLPQDSTSNIHSPLGSPQLQHLFPSNIDKENLQNTQPSPMPSSEALPQSYTTGHFEHHPDLNQNIPENANGGPPSDSTGLAPASSVKAPSRDPSRRLSRIPVLEPSCLLQDVLMGSAKEKLLQKQGQRLSNSPCASTCASPSLSSVQRDRLSSTSASERSQDDESIPGLRQGDDAPSLSFSSLSHKSKIPRPVRQQQSQFLPRPPPGKPPCRSSADGR